jgi:hypothetical protein
MADTNVPPSPGPILGPPSGSHGRFILQHFTPQDDYTARNSPHNQDARLPADMSQFPPNIIVDTFYGCAAFLQWGTPQASEAIVSSTQDLYYDVTRSGEDSPGAAEGGEVDMEGGRSPTPIESLRDIRSRLESHLARMPRLNGVCMSFERFNHLLTCLCIPYPDCLV